jgi:ribosomal-protein-alanine N-acetyltransferase
METRLAVLADAPALAALHAESFDDARWNLHQITDSLELATTLGLIVIDNGIAQGFILCQWTGDEAEILTLCVAPRARHKGAGQLLLATAIETAKKKSARRMFLEVATDNVIALSLYEKAGFKMLGIRRGYYQHNGKSVDGMSFSLAL